MQNFKAQKWQFWARGRLSCFSPKYVCWSWERYGLFPNLTTLTALEYLGCNNNKNYLQLYIFFSISSPLNYMLTFPLLAEEQHISQYCCLSVCGTRGMMLRNTPRAVCCGLHLQPGTKSEKLQQLPKDRFIKELNTLNQKGGAVSVLKDQGLRISLGFSFRQGWTIFHWQRSQPFWPKWYMIECFCFPASQCLTLLSMDASY